MDNKKIFISHSSEDVEFISAIMELFEDIGLSEDSIFCSSISGYGIPLGKDIYDYLAKEFKENELHVVFCLSENYYKSIACLNEMGAAWVLKNEYTTILLPGFSFKQIQGAINPRKIGINLGGDKQDLYQRLGELKDYLIKTFDLQPMSAAKWERYRNSFSSKIDSINPAIQQNNIKNAYTATLSRDATVLLAYAGAEDYGQIVVIRSISGLQVQTKEWNFVNSGSSNREEARWLAAIEELERYNLIVATSYKRQIFNLTNEGFKYSDIARKQIDTDKSPDEYLDDK